MVQIVFKILKYLTYIGSKLICCIGSGFFVNLQLYVSAETTRDFPVEIQTSVFQMKTPLFYSKLFSGKFF